MSRGFLGYVGTIGATNFTASIYTGIATNQDLDALSSLKPSLPFVLEPPSTYGAFGGGAQTSYDTDSLSNGVLIDGNLNIGTSTENFPGGYKLTIGKACILEFHIWAAGGGDANSGHGGYTKYTAQFQASDEIGLYLPGWSGDPSTDAEKKAACWPDAGHGGNGNSYHGYSGGGSARIGTWYTSQTAMNASSAAYYAIAGGAGGVHMYSAQMAHGGGTSGDTAANGSYSAGGGGGGTQSAGGAGGVASSYGGTGQSGSKYQGGNGVAYSSYGGGGGGGGGYYGGGAGGTVYASGGAGSGYVDTGFSGYVSGATYTGTDSGPPAGVGYNKPANAGESNKRGAIFFKKIL